VAAPICPQLGQTIRVSMSVDYRRSRRGRKSVKASSTAPAVGDVRGDAPRLVAGDGRWR
jgi:hypothetical protein